MSVTVTEVLLKTAKKYPSKAAVKYKENGNWQSMTWSQYKDEIYTIARGMLHLGLEEEAKKYAIPDDLELKNSMIQQFILENMEDEEKYTIFPAIKEYD